MPSFPSRNIDTVVVKKINGKYETTNNHIPFFELSIDGRLAFARRGFGGGQPLYVLKPESVVGHLRDTRNPKFGAGLINNQKPYIFKALNLYGSDARQIPAGFKPRQNLICEKTDKYHNPQACENGKDCYNLTIVSSLSQSDNENEDSEESNKRTYILTSIDVKVIVANPKTVDAKIEKVEPIPNTFKMGKQLKYNIIAEPTIAGDSRLLVTRLGFDNATLPGSSTIVPKTNIVYSVYDKNLEQCDPSKWSRFHPISLAPFDEINQMPKRYKFARYPFRDSLGREIVRKNIDGTFNLKSLEVGSSYPWMDRFAVNLFFQSFGLETFYNYDERTKTVVTPYREQQSSNYFSLEGLFFNTKKAYDLKDDLVQAPAPRTIGTSVVGFWTHGKMVLFDGLINNADNPFRTADRFSRKIPDPNNPSKKIFDPNSRISVNRKIALYEDTPSNQTYESVGAVRDLNIQLTNEYHHLLTPNTSFLGSIENRFNLVEAAKPVTPRDVVWSFGNSRHTDELVFDDFMSPYFLINSEMTAAISASDNITRMKHYTGIKSGIHLNTSFVGFPINPPLTSILLQNASTAPDSFMKTPGYGKITGEARIEPISKGGIYGKGLWLQTSTSVQYQVPDQSGSSFGLNTKRWYVGIFIEPNESLRIGEKRNLISIQSNGIVVTKRDPSQGTFDTITLNKNNIEIASIKIPLPLQPKLKKWNHLGFMFFPQKKPELYLNGYMLGTFSMKSGISVNQLAGFFEPKSNDIILFGSNPQNSLQGMAGWYDDFKVRAQVPVAEEKCNYSRGTLVKIISKNNPRYSRAGLYSAEYHSRLQNSAKENDPSARYMCYTSYYDDAEDESLKTIEMHAHLKNIPSGLEPVREKLLGIHGNLVFDSPRPSQEKNRFCLSCHVDKSHNPFSEINNFALKFKPNLIMQKDPRRQPLQPLAKISGVIPADYFGRGMPSRELSALNSGRHIDEWLHPKIEKVKISWNKLTPDTKYRLDLVLNDGNNRFIHRFCATANIIGQNNSFIFNGSCPSLASLPKQKIDSRLRVRICYWKASGESKIGCSHFTPVTYHKNGALKIFLNGALMEPIDMIDDPANDET